MPKTILFDGMNLALARGTGVATYTRVLVNLARRLQYRTGILYARHSKLPAIDAIREISFFDVETPENKFRLSIGTVLGTLSAAAMGVRPQKVPLSGTVVTAPLGTSFVPSDEIYSAPYLFDRAYALYSLGGPFLNVNLPDRPDIFHWTFPIPLRSNARANIYTVHDLVPLRLPYATADKKQAYLRMLRRIGAKADHIVTVSENSKRDMINILGIDEKRITNTYQAVDMPRYEESEDIAAKELSNTFGLDMRGYLLFYGSLEPKKNIGRIVQAYLAADIRIPLVVVFAQSWLVENEVELLEQALELAGQNQLPKGKRVIRYEYLPFRLLTTLIRGARAVVFPSLYEGFGLPVLESMALGTPVITSNTSSTPEVAGDAAILVNPHDVDAITNAMVSICNDNDLCAELRARGLKQAQLFSTDRYAERLADLYRSLT